MLCTEEMSRVAKLGDWSTCQTMAGTPPKLVMRSRSMSSRARSGSHLYMITSLPPEARLATRTEWQPVAWKKGTDRRYAGWSDGAAAAGAADADPERRAERAAPKPKLTRLVQM